MMVWRAYVNLIHSSRLATQIVSIYMMVLVMRTTIHIVVPTINHVAQAKPVLVKYANPELKVTNMPMIV